MSPESYSFLLETAEPEQVSAIRHALTAASIPYEAALQAESTPWVVFFVPGRHLVAARAIVAPYFDATDEREHPDDPTPPREFPALGMPPHEFPKGPIQAVASLVLMHLALVFLPATPFAPDGLLMQGGIVSGLTFQEPWRLFTSMFLHVDPRHVLWNALSTLVFAVPLIVYLGYARTAAVYSIAGLGGGLAALWFATPGSITVGSSGAVAGLFGAWIMLTHRRVRWESPGWRMQIRSWGIALLVLPSFLNPTTSTGQPISVSSHLGGMITGMLIGALISSRMLGGAATPRRGRADR